MTAETEVDRPTGMARGRVRVTQRGIQIGLGVIWLVAGILQFQSFMYTHDLITQVFAPTAQDQPAFIAHAINSVDAFYGRNQVVWNTLAGEIQCAIGLGLIAGRRFVKPALAASFGWAFLVWWFGEGFGGLTSHTAPSALMGAPGAVIIYAIIGLLVWPTGKVGGRSPVDGGPLGDRGGLIAWSGLWVLSALLWLPGDNRAPSAFHDMVSGMAGSSPGWLASFQNGVANRSQGHGDTIAVALCVVSLLVAAGVWTRLRWVALGVGIAISLCYWVLGQSLGGPFWGGSATDVNSAPLFVLLAVALFPVRQPVEAAPAQAERAVEADPAFAG